MSAPLTLLQFQNVFKSCLSRATEELIWASSQITRITRISYITPFHFHVHRRKERTFTTTPFCSATCRKHQYLPPVHCPVRRRCLLSSSLCSSQGCFFLPAHLTLYLLLLLTMMDLWMHLLQKEITELSSPHFSKQTPTQNSQHLTTSFPCNRGDTLCY